MLREVWILIDVTGCWHPLSVPISWSMAALRHKTEASFKICAVSSRVDDVTSEV